jgi:hypothetical protein
MFVCEWSIVFFRVTASKKINTLLRKCYKEDRGRLSKWKPGWINSSSDLEERYRSHPALVPFTVTNSNPGAFLTPTHKQIFTLFVSNHYAALCISDLIYAGDAATKALKLYDGGVVLKFMPAGANVTASLPLRVIFAATLQFSLSASFCFEIPAGTLENVCVDEPQVSVRSAGCVRWNCAQSVSEAQFCRDTSQSCRRMTMQA